MQRGRTDGEPGGTGRVGAGWGWHGWWGSLSHAIADGGLGAADEHCLLRRVSLHAVATATGRPLAVPWLGPGRWGGVVRAIVHDPAITPPVPLLPAVALPFALPGNRAWWRFKSDEER